jgi:hypothetical protein
MRREKSLRIDVHHADAVVWEPVYTPATRGSGRRRRARSGAERTHDAGGRLCKTTIRNSSTVIVATSSVVLRAARKK